jgi:hypothetical protein
MGKLWLRQKINMYEYEYRSYSVMHLLMNALSIFANDDLGSIPGKNTTLLDVYGRWQCPRHTYMDTPLNTW